MDIAFIGGIFPKYLESEIIENSRGKIDYAANNLQQAFIESLGETARNFIHIFNLLFIGSFPYGYKKLKIKSASFSYQSYAKGINIGFVNLPGIKLLHRCIACTRKLINWAIIPREKKIILVYSIHSPFLIASVIAKLFNGRLKTCLIVPDLPQFMSDSKNLFYRFLKLLDGLIINLCIKSIDSFILLSDEMITKIKIGNRPYIRIEGIFNTRNYPIASQKSIDRVIMYSGNLDIKQGIADLIKAFSLIENENYKLWITGTGNGISYINKAARVDKRITYFSKVEQSKLYEMHQQATLLVNPLKPSHNKAPYFFPSKTIEFMASGTPLLMHKLPGIPFEYHRFLYFFDDITTLNMKKKIVELCNKTQDELNNFGQKSRRFIINEKTTTVQGQKIQSFLSELF